MQEMRSDFFERQFGFQVFQSVIINVYNLMPKLRKHSNLNQSQEDEDQNQPSNSAYMGNKSQQSNSLLDKAPPLGRKMKYSQRAHRLKQFDNRAKVKQTKNRQTNSLIHAPQHQDKVTMDTYFNKFTDDDKESSKESHIMATKAKAKKGIRVSNKFFTNYELDQGEIDQKQFETDQLLVQKKQVKNACYLLNKVQKKAQNFKNRLQFKNFQQDIKFKQNMKDKLKSLEGCEQVQLLIEVPKVSGKGSHTDAALFLKNVKPTLDASLTNQPSPEVQEEQIPKDRKSFYEGLVKKMKIKKSESITQSILKENFKKSKLDQNDFIYDFREKQDSIIRGRNSNKEIHKQIEKPPQQSNHIEQKRQEQEINKVTKGKIQQSNEVQNFISQKQKCLQTTVQEQKCQIQNKPIKVKKPRKKRRTQKMCIKDLIQEQAEDSDDGFQVNKEDNEEHSNQDGDLSSLIDDSITLCQEDEKLAHRKFIKDMMEQQERKFAILQKKMQEQKMFQNEQLRMRMQAASKRNNQRDQKQAVYSVQQEKKSAEPSEQSISNAKNMQKIKQLQIDLGLKKPAVSSQSNPISQRQTVNKSISNIQKLLAIQVADIRKPARNGLKNVGGLKVKQMKKVK